MFIAYLLSRSLWTSADFLSFKLSRQHSVDDAADIIVPPTGAGGKAEYLILHRGNYIALRFGFFKIEVYNALLAPVIFKHKAVAVADHIGNIGGEHLIPEYFITIIN